MVNNSQFLNKDVLWALNERGLDALNLMVRKGLDMDLAFELLGKLFEEDEIYESFR